MQNKVFTIGSATLDIVVLLASDKVEQLTLTNADVSYLLITLGSKIESKKINTYIGGGAINTAFNYHKLGMDCSPIVKCGNDLDKQYIEKSLLSSSIKTNYVFTDEELETGSSIIISSHTGDAAVLNQAGANTNLKPNDLKDVNWQDLSLLHIAPLNHDKSGLFEYCVEAAAKQNAFIVVNLGRKQIEQHFDKYLAVANKTNLLSINYQEAVTMLKQFLDKDTLIAESTEKTISIGNIDFNYDFTQLAKLLHNAGVNYILMTNGAKGAWLSNNGKVTFVDSIKTEVVSTTGAGDAFCSTVAWALSQGMNEKDALYAATLNSSSVVGYEDTTSGLLSKEELLSKLKN